MQLHRLDLAAFGPYAGREHVDFAELAASGVFLLEGPTGAGKSTVIDAIVFALYGSLAADGSSDDRLHSQHALPTEEPVVDLVFETSAGVHRIRRTPAFDRPKRNGSGTTRQNASVTLWRLASPDDAVGEPVSSRAQEVGVEIARIVGLSREQFVQTVVLPQGQFARFLTAPGEDRRKLLQSLFGTEIYDRTAAVLAERRREAAVAVEAAEAAVRDASGRFAQAAGAALRAVDDGEDAAAGDVADGVVDLALAARVAAACATTAEEASAARTAAQHVAATARAALDVARRRHDAVLRRDDLVAQAAALRADAADVDAARARLLLAERASRVLGVVGGLRAAEGRLAERRRALDRIVASTATAHVERVSAAAPSADPDVLGIDADTARRRIRALREAAAGARSALGVDAALPGREAALADAREDIDRAAAALVDDAARLETRPGLRDAVLAEIATARAGAADRLPAEHELAEATALLATTTARAAASVTVTEAQTAVATAAATARAAVAVESDLRARRIAGLAGELGLALVDAEPCPVCGSSEHPRPASAADDHPTPERIDEAAAERSRADGLLSAATVELRLAEQELERLDAAIGDRSEEAVRAAVEAAEQRVRRAAAAEADAATHEARLRAFDADTSALERTLAASTTRLAERRAACDAETAAIAVAKDSIAAVRNELLALDPGDAVAADAGLAAVVRAVVAEADAIAEVAAAAEQVDAGIADVASRTTEASRALVDEGFADVDAADAGRLDVVAAQELRQRVADHERRDAIVASALASPEILDVGDRTEADVDLPAAVDSATAAEAALESAAARAATEGDRDAQVRSCRTALVAAHRRRDELSASVRAVVRLADLASGAPGVNPTGITLGTYVLMRRFEDVVAAANGRLRGMFAGRFELETSDARESGSRSRRTGLALAVRDHDVDRTRDPRSLSGGETFTVSLCLALGLADIVQAESGGVRLGTLFVDEGFGTLDPETLDDVIGQLSALTAGGRQVGIVSHVEELKQRIPDRIEVRRAPGGGSTLRTTAALGSAATGSAPLG